VIGLTVGKRSFFLRGFQCFETRTRYVFILALLFWFVGFVFLPFPRFHNAWDAARRSLPQFFLLFEPSFAFFNLALEGFFISSFSVFFLLSLKDPIYEGRLKLSHPSRFSLSSPPRCTTVAAVVTPLTQLDPCFSILGFFLPHSLDPPVILYRYFPSPSPCFLSLCSWS